MADTEESLLAKLENSGKTINDIIKRIKAKHWRRGFEYLLNTGKPGLLTVNLKNNEIRDPYHLRNSNEKLSRQRDRGEKIRKNAKNNLNTSYITFSTKEIEDDIEEVLDQWTPKYNRRIIHIEDHFNQKIKFHYTSYRALVSLHNKILLVVPKYKLFGGSKQAIEILRNYRSNQKWIYREFQEIELYIQNPPSIAPEIQKEVDDINKELDKIEKRILAVIDKAEDASYNQEVNKMRANKILAQWTVPPPTDISDTSTQQHDSDDDGSGCREDNLRNNNTSPQLTNTNTVANKTTKVNNNSKTANTNVNHRFKQTIKSSEDGSRAAPVSPPRAVANKTAKVNNNIIRHQVYGRWAISSLDLTSLSEKKAVTKHTPSQSTARSHSSSAPKAAAKHVPSHTSQSNATTPTTVPQTADPVSSAVELVPAKVVRTRSQSRAQGCDTSTPVAARQTSVSSSALSGVKRKASAIDLDSSLEPPRKRK